MRAHERTLSSVVFAIVSLVVVACGGSDTTDFMGNGSTGTGGSGGADGTAGAQGSADSGSVMGSGVAPRTAEPLEPAVPTKPGLLVAQECQRPEAHQGLPVGPERCPTTQVFDPTRPFAQAWSARHLPACSLQLRAMLPTSPTASSRSTSSTAAARAPPTASTMAHARRSARPKRRVPRRTRRRRPAPMRPSRPIPERQRASRPTSSFVAFQRRGARPASAKRSSARTTAVGPRPALLVAAVSSVGRFPIWRVSSPVARSTACPRQRVCLAHRRSSGGLCPKTR